VVNLLGDEPFPSPFFSVPVCAEQVNCWVGGTLVSLLLPLIVSVRSFEFFFLVSGFSCRSVQITCSLEIV